MNAGLDEKLEGGPVGDIYIFFIEFKAVNIVALMFDLCQGEHPRSFYFIFGWVVLEVFHEARAAVFWLKEEALFFRLLQWLGAEIRSFIVYRLFEHQVEVHLSIEEVFFDQVNHCWQLLACPLEEIAPIYHAFGLLYEYGEEMIEEWILFLKFFDFLPQRRYLLLIDNILLLPIFELMQD